MPDYNLYLYDGPVYNFGSMICDKYKMYTYAVSEKKAKSNMAFRYKMACGMPVNYKISLPNDLKIVPYEKEVDHYIQGQLCFDFKTLSTYIL